MIYLLIGYMWLFIHRPFEFWPVLGTIRLERVYMIMMIGAWPMSGRFRWHSNGLSYSYLAFTAVLLLCWVASPWSGNVASQTVIEDYLKILVFFVILVTSVRNERDLRLLVLGFLGVMALYMGHSFREYLSGRHTYRMGVARMVGVDTSLGDPNSFAASVMYALPLAPLIRKIVPDRRGGVLTLCYVVLSVTCIVLTGSRTAFVGMLGWLGLMSVNVKRKLLWVVLGAILLPALLRVVPEDHKTRFTTLIDPSVGSASAQESAESRGEGFRLGQKLLGKYPLTGCGPGAWIPATRSPVESHNLYGQVMGELGVLGVLTFGAIVLGMAANVLAIRSACRARPAGPNDFPRALAVALGHALILLLLMGWGGHNLYRFSWLWYGGFLIVARDVVSRRRAVNSSGSEAGSRVFAGAAARPSLNRAW